MMLRPHKKLKPPPALSDHPSTRRWEDLDVDCLANVLARVGMESLLLSLPFVCKSWYAASLDPSCWNMLSFPDFEPYPLFNTVHNTNVEPKSFGVFYNKFVEEYHIDNSRFSITGFIKLVVDRSKGKALELKLPRFCTEEALRYVADACPGIKRLSFSDDLVVFKHSQILPEVIGKWKLLEHLILGGNMENLMEQFGVKSGDYLSRDFEDKVLSLDKELSLDVIPARNKNLLQILVQVGIHCKRIRSLHILDVCVGEYEASAIVKGLPNLVFLTLARSRIERKALVMLLEGCKKLRCFDVRNCEGFQADGEELQKLGSHIKEFKWTWDLTGYNHFHAVKMVILAQAKLNQLMRMSRRRQNRC
ncbi:F-box protein SKIP1-like [Argentina anserina]|uniref:F-box protein SKIP1-like n=1 Tax=Argentina anserina TaxID=57926 RepID=UPI0021765DE9|nr:F-box protein SKIP1-like [Potentilla anserina]